jgi:hypothetical protein
MENKIEMTKEEKKAAAKLRRELDRTLERQREELYERIGKERTLIQNNLLDLHMKGADYGVVVGTLTSLSKAGTRETKIGEAAEWILTNVQEDLFGDFLDDEE